jgi:hypothetical protein
MAEQIAALSALLGQQLEAEGWGQEAAAAAVLAAGGPGQLEPLLQVRDLQFGEVAVLAIGQE